MSRRALLTLVLLWSLGLALGAARKARVVPQGAIPPPDKERPNTSDAKPTKARDKQILDSSHEALIITERRYLKQDWCKSQPLRQTITEEGCLSHTIINRFCYGQCNSFYIPRHGRQGEEDAFKSCAFCRPQKIISTVVELQCPDLQPPFKLKRVQKVKTCRCTAVDIKDL
ncbi:gremlin-2-like [Petromyzon marinus]|uniref:Gremlin-2-like n=1 Tax=Petromyzon marinus TaxID=7757 RepID=A0AAJ7SSY1_PETMA|nr:gremlin-2-like [Petromyzon marinus]XP_061415309.1 gremlin-2-like [Lethenteron reissneri]